VREASQRNWKGYAGFAHFHELHGSLCQGYLRATGRRGCQTATRQAKGWGLTAAAEAQNYLCLQNADRSWGLRRMQALFPKVSSLPSPFFFAYLKKSCISPGRLGCNGSVLQ